MVLHLGRWPLAHRRDRALLPQQGAGVGLPQLRRSHQGAAQLPGLCGGRPWRAGNRPAQRPPGWRTDARAVAVCQGLRQPVREPALAGSQQERYNDEQQQGAITTLTWRPKVAWAHEFTLEGGLDAQRQSNLGQRYRTTERVRTSQFRDWDFDLHTQGAYVQAVIRPIEALRIIPALRIDDVDGHFIDRLAGTRAPVHDYGLIKQPKISIAYTLSQQASVYANWAGPSRSARASTPTARRIATSGPPSMMAGKRASSSLPCPGSTAAWPTGSSAPRARWPGCWAWTACPTRAAWATWARRCARATTYSST
ncbi:unnamed protein product [Ilex paraguariensis]|uniref:TonB-dependent receptor-like beta-barrel domain-containing protein n=1 Tax=Ilex paraguariensis TaxID=185542 RepID=A0ABC8V412_9AQUA